MSDHSSKPATHRLSSDVLTRVNQADHLARKLREVLNLVNGASGAVVWDDGNDEVRVELPCSDGGTATQVLVRNSVGYWRVEE